MSVITERPIIKPVSSARPTRETVRKRLEERAITTRPSTILWQEKGRTVLSVGTTQSPFGENDPKSLFDRQEHGDEHYDIFVRGIEERSDTTKITYKKTPPSHP